METAKGRKSDLPQQTVLVYDIETEGNVSGTRPSEKPRKDSQSVL